MIHNKTLRSCRLCLCMRFGYFDMRKSGLSQPQNTKNLVPKELVEDGVGKEERGVITDGYELRDIGEEVVSNLVAGIDEGVKVVDNTHCKLN